MKNSMSVRFVVWHPPFAALPVVCVLWLYFNPWSSGIVKYGVWFKIAKQFFNCALVGGRGMECLSYTQQGMRCRGSLTLLSFFLKGSTTRTDTTVWPRTGV